MDKKAFVFQFSFSFLDFLFQFQIVYRFINEILISIRSLNFDEYVVCNESINKSTRIKKKATCL